MPGQKRAADPSVASPSDAKKSKHEDDLLQISQVQRFQVLFRAYQADAEAAASSSSRSSSDTTLGPAGVPYLPYEGTRLNAVLDDWVQQLTRFKEADNGTKKLAPQVHAQLDALAAAVHHVLETLYCGATAEENTPLDSLAFEDLLSDLRPEPQSERISSAEKQFEDGLAVPLQQCEDILPPHGTGKEARMRWQSHFLAEVACSTATLSDDGKDMKPLYRALIQSVRDSGQDTCACCQVFDMDATDNDICKPALLHLGVVCPPVVVPACGHAVCTECFEELAINPFPDAGQRGFGGCVICDAAYDWSNGMLLFLADVVALWHSQSFSGVVEFKEENRATETTDFAAAVLRSLQAAGLDNMFREDIEEEGEHGEMLSAAKYVMEKVWETAESLEVAVPPKEWREAAVERAAELMADGFEGDDEDAEDEDADDEDAEDEEQDDDET